MIRETIARIEEKLKNAGSLNAESRRELETLLDKLKTEITELSKTDADQAQSIASFVQASAHEATRGAKNPELLELSLRGLATSVEGFEESHPKLVQIVNQICTALSSLGI